MYKWGLLVFLFLGSCIKDNLDNGNHLMGYDYFPLTPKRIYSYKVDSIFFNGFDNTIDTFNYEVRETIDTFFNDNQNQQVTRVVISRRDNETEPWKTLKSIYLKMSDDYFERVEDNLRYLKLSFPLNPEKVWNLNERNTIKENLVFYTALHVPYQNQYMHTDSSIVVESESIHNIFQDVEYKEIYGKNIGLMYLRRINKFAQLNKKTGYQITYHLYDVK